MDTNKLNQNFGIPGRMEFINGQGDLAFIRVRNQSTDALISLHGGQILSFKPHQHAHNLLFLSKKAMYQDGQSIHGGIPICWPWFGPDPIGLNRPNHGFVRDYLWEVTKSSSTEAETKIILQFSETNKKETTWKQPFLLEQEFTVGESLTLKLTARNTGGKAFSVTESFHAYFHIGDISQVQISGLENRAYYDKLDQGEQKHQTGPVNIGAEVDRVYEEAGSFLTLYDPVFHRRIGIHSENCQTAVVWNPWHKRFPDLEAEDYRNFVCVETGNMAFDKVLIAPGEKHSISTAYSILPWQKAGLE